MHLPIILTDNKTMTTNGKNVVERIDRVLVLKNIKRAVLCTSVDITVTSLSDWSRRNTVPAADVLYNIAQFLDVSMEWLLTGEDADGLTPDKRDLLRKFEILDDRDRAAVVQLIDTMGVRYLASETVEPEQSTGAVG